MLVSLQLLLAAAVSCWAQADSLVKARGNQLMVLLAIRQQVCQILESGGDVIVVVVVLVM